MEITIYSLPHCSMCRMIKQKLNEKQIQFTDIEDEEKTLELGTKHSILSAPIVEIDSEFFNVQQAGRKLGL